MYIYIYIRRPVMYAATAYIVKTYCYYLSLVAIFITFLSIFIGIKLFGRITLWAALWTT